MGKSNFQTLKEDFLAKRPKVSYATKKLMVLADNTQHARNIYDFQMFKQKTLKIVRKHW